MKNDTVIISFPELLKEVMTTRNVTVDALEEASKVSARTIRYYRRGLWNNKQQKPNPRKIAQLALALGQDPQQWCATATVTLLTSDLEDARRIVETSESYGRRTTEYLSTADKVDMAITAEDLRYLLCVMKGLKQPLKISILIELIRCRRVSS